MKKFSMGFWVRLLVSATLVGLFVSPPSLIFNHHWYGTFLLSSALFILGWPVAVALLMTIMFPLSCIMDLSEYGKYTPVKDLKDCYRAIGWYHRFLFQKPRPWLIGIPLGIAAVGLVLVLMNTSAG